MHYILFTYSFLKLPFNVSLSTPTGVRISKKVCNLICTKNLKLEVLKFETHRTLDPRNIWNLQKLCLPLLSFWPNPILGNSHFHSSFDTQRQTIDLFINVLNRRWIPIFPKLSLSHFSLTLVCLSSRADHPNLIAIFQKPSKKTKWSHIFIFLHKRWIFLRFLETEVELSLDLD